MNDEREFLEKNQEEVKRLLKSIKQNPWLLRTPLTIACYCKNFDFKSVEPTTGDESRGSIGILKLSNAELLMPARQELFRVPAKNSFGDQELALMLVMCKREEEVREVFLRSSPEVSKGSSRKIVFSESDPYAEVTKWLVGLEIDSDAKSIIDRKFISVNTNTITDRSLQFSTISTIYRIVEILGEELDLFDKNILEARKLYWTVQPVLVKLLNDFEPFRKALAYDGKNLPELRRHFLCLKPTGQVVVAKTVKMAKAYELSIDEIIKKLNAIDWHPGNNLWENVLIDSNGRLSFTDRSINITAELLTYVIAGHRFSSNQREKLELTLQKFTHDARRELPKPLN